jgi:hypothetical protein
MMGQSVAVGLLPHRDAHAGSMRNIILALLVVDSSTLVLKQSLDLNPAIASEMTTRFPRL